MYNCPRCKGKLLRVRNPPDSMLNDYQFDAIRAGDWYCTHCSGNEAASGYKYWWQSDLEKAKEATDA
jgi:hypothetical protein